MRKIAKNMFIIFNLIPLIKFNTLFSSSSFSRNSEKVTIHVVNVPFDRQDQPQKQINDVALNFAGFYLT